MSIPYLQQAHGLTPTLPPGMARWSINELSALVLDDANQSDPGNVETRIWRSSLPVIHLAAAVAVAISEGERTGHPHTSYGDILCNKNLIEEIISRAEMPRKPYQKQ
jgi:hypothetical protein